MLGANELKRGAMIMISGEPYQVADVFVAPPSARGASTMVRTKVRHLLSGAVQEKTFKTSEKFNQADVETVEANFLYKDGEGYHFMDQVTFEMAELLQSMVGDSAGFLHEQLTVKIMKYNGTPVSLELPQFVNLKIVQAEQVAQQAGSAGTKNAVFETGLSVRVPKHISSGETVRVNTETGEVTGRV